MDLKPQNFSFFRRNDLDKSASSRILVNSKSSTDIEKSDVFEPNKFKKVFINDEIESSWKKWCNQIKVATLIAVWIISSYALMMNSAKTPEGHQISISTGEVKKYLIREAPTGDKVEIAITGALIPLYYKNMSENWMSIWVQLKVFNNINETNVQFVQNVSELWKVPLVSLNLVENVPSVTYRKTIHLQSFQVSKSLHSLLELQFSTNTPGNFPVVMVYNLDPINPDLGIIYAALVLVGLYVIIIFELVHRTLAAMLASTLSVAILASLNARPTMSEIISWIDIETLLLLFSMMILVSVLSETGVFDYMSVVTYRMTGGKIWPLIHTLCIITALLSCCLDNVTTTLLITPVTIRLSEVMKLNPVPVLTYLLIFSNIGGAITPIGDPPNVVIVSNLDVIKAGVNFGVFTLHMSFGAIITFIIVYLQLRYTHRDLKIFKYSLPSDVEELKRKIAIWNRAANSLTSYSRDEENVKESILKQSTNLLGKLRVRIRSTSIIEEEYTSNLNDLKVAYPIKNKRLLIKAGLTLFLVILVFFLHSVPETSRLGLGWTALLGALLLLLLYDENIESVFCRVEWSTLLFFASLFIMMEALARLGLIDWVGFKTKNIIMSVNQEARLTVAIILILWVSGVASAFVDNLPLTTMMIRIATNLADNHELNLPLQPLVWSLSFGACFGGIGTLFGSSSNIVCAGVAEQHGHRFSFKDYFKIGFPVMITSLVTITCYLIVCHVVFCWH